MDFLKGRQSVAFTASVLFVATLLLRIPFCSHVLSSVDSVNFALALERYDVVEGQPHPTGNFLYIGAGHIFEFLTGDPTAGLVALSVFSSALAVAVIFLVGVHIFDYKTGLAAAALLLFSPVSWFYGEIALTYEVELVLVTVFIWLLYEMLFHQRLAIAAAACLAVAGGFRLDTMVFLLPVFAFATFRLPRRQALLSWGVLACVNLVWLVPFLLLLPSLRSYLDVAHAQFPALTTVQMSGARALWLNLTSVWDGYIWLFGSAFPVIALLGLLLARKDRRDLFLLAVLLVPIGFFLLEHFGQFGYLLVFSAPIFLIGGRILMRISSWLGDLAGKYFQIPVYGKTVLLLTVLGAVSILNAFLYFKGAEITQRSLFTTDSVGKTFGVYTESRLSYLDTLTSQTLELVHKFKPDDTLIVSVEPSDNFGWRKLMYYCPDYRTVGIGSSLSDGELYDALNHFEPDFLYRHGRLGEWKSNHFDVTVGLQYRNILIFGADSSQAPASALTRLSPDGSNVTAYLGHLGSGQDAIQIGDYHIHFG